MRDNKGFKKYLNQRFQLCQIFVCIVRSNDLTAGIDEIIQFFAFYNVEQALYALIAHVVRILCNGAGDLAVNNGLYAGGNAVEAAYDDAVAVTARLLDGTGSAECNVICTAYDRVDVRERLENAIGYGALSPTPSVYWVEMISQPPSSSAFL